MEKIVIASLLLCCSSLLSNGQVVAVAADKMNVLYIGLDNPLTIIAENVPAKSLIVKTTNGTVSGANGSYYSRPVRPGRGDIILYKKVNGQLKEIGRSSFRIKRVPPPVFRIGPYHNGDSVDKTVIQAQEFVRAPIENSDFNANYSIKSFTVQILSCDTCKHPERSNISGRISDEIRKDFDGLQKADIIIFDKIKCVGPDATALILPPTILIVK